MIPTMPTSSVRITHFSTPNVPCRRVGGVVEATTAPETPVRYYDQAWLRRAAAWLAETMTVRRQEVPRAKLVWKL